MDANNTAITANHPSLNVDRLNRTFTPQYGMLPIGLPLAPFGDHQVTIVILSIFLLIVILVLLIGLFFLHYRHSSRYLSYDRFTDEPEHLRHNHEEHPVVIKTIDIPQNESTYEDVAINSDKEMLTSRRYEGVRVQDGASFVGMNRPILAENSRL